MTEFRLALTGATGAARIALSADGVEVVPPAPFDTAGIDALDVFGPTFDGDLDAAKKGLEARIGAAILGTLKDAPHARLWIAIEPTVAVEHLPWELVRAGKLSVGLRHQLVFEVPGPGPVAPPNTWPVRVLVWVGSKPRDTAVLAEAELKRMEVHLDQGTRGKGWTRADIQLLHHVNPTRAAFSDRFLTFLPHVLHFVGHGRAEPEPALLVELPARTEAWTIDDVDKLFSRLKDPAHVPRLVVLNACDTARELGRSALSEAFAAWGVPAVVAMVGPIPGAVAGEFSSRLYEELRGGKDVPDAFHEARSHLTTVDDAHPGAFAVPRLYLRRSGTPATRILGEVPAAAVAGRAALVGEALRDTTWFSDRHDVRWQLWDRVCSEGATALVGATSVGKSSVAKVIAERALLYGRVARYVDLKLWGAFPTWLEVLQSIRDVHPLADADIAAPWPVAAAFGRFNGMLRVLTSIRDFPGAIPAVAPEENAPPRLPAIVTGAEPQGRSVLVGLLRSALAAQAETHPVVLVLDHVRPELALDWLLRDLVQPIQGVHVVVVGEERLFDGVKVERVSVPNLVGCDVAEVLAARLEGGHPDRATQLREDVKSARTNRLYASFLMEAVPEADR